MAKTNRSRWALQREEVSAWTTAAEKSNSQTLISVQLPDTVVPMGKKKEKRKKERQNYSRTMSKQQQQKTNKQTNKKKQCERICSDHCHDPNKEL